MSKVRFLCPLPLVGVDLGSVMQGGTAVLVGVFGEAAGRPVVFKLPEVFVFAVDPREEEDEAGTINELIVAFPRSEAR